MCLKVLLVIVYVCTNVWVSTQETCNKNDPEFDGYYWRDYTGVIPKDALAGGKSEQGDAIYIGQVFARNQLIPAKIEIVPKRVTYEWGYGEYNVTVNIKILCTHHPERFEWIPTHFTTFRADVNGRHLVPGGYEAGDRELFIGHKFFENELTVGKVLSLKTQTTFHCTKNGKGFQHDNTYDVLIYNPDKMVPEKDYGVKCNKKLIVVNVFNA